MNFKHLLIIGFAIAIISMHVIKNNSMKNANEKNFIKTSKKEKIGVAFVYK